MRNLNHTYTFSIRARLTTWDKTKIHIYSYTVRVECIAHFLFENKINKYDYYVIESELQ